MRRFVDIDAGVRVMNGPTIFGHKEAAKALGVTRQRIQQLTVQGRFPKPDAVLAATPLWSYRTLCEFVATFKDGRL